MAVTYRRIAYDDLHEFVAAVLQKVGVGDEDANLVADVLVASDLRGVESHGTARLKNFYVDRIVEGIIDPRAVLTVARETPVTVAFDANNGLGHPASVKAMRRTIEKARENGLCLTTVRHSNHYGIAGYYAMMALEYGLIGISMTNTLLYGAPTFGRERMLGTNPISVAVPGDREQPFVLDMATTTVALGKLEIARRKGDPLKPGWALDADGNETLVPEQGQAGALLPLGGLGTENGGHKGYGLSLLVDILCGVLAGGVFGTQHQRGGIVNPAETGHFFGAIQVEAFRDLAGFTDDMDTLVRMFNQSAPAPGHDRVLVAGQPEWEKSERYRAEGIPLDGVVAQTLDTLAETYALPLKWKETA